MLHDIVVEKQYEVLIESHTDTLDRKSDCDGEEETARWYDSFKSSETSSLAHKGSAKEGELPCEHTVPF